MKSSKEWKIGGLYWIELDSIRLHVNSRKWLICCKVMTLPKLYTLHSYLIM